MTSFNTSTPKKRMNRSFRVPIKSVLQTLACVCIFLLGATTTFAQTGGEAGIQGTVTDPSGASIPHATVTATNTATGVASTRETTGDGLYTISPILPGSYTVTVKADGFSQFVQQNF